MKQRLLFLFLVVHVLVVGFVILPRLYAYERGIVPNPGPAVWRYAAPTANTVPPDAPADAEAIGSCLWPQANDGGAAVTPDDDAPPLVIGHAFCLRLAPERPAGKSGGAPSYRT